MSLIKYALALLLAVSLSGCNQPLEWHATEITGMSPDLRFTLTGPDGAAVSAESLRGKTTLLFFGFTSCPDVCPTTLTQLSVVMEKLSDHAQDLQVLLVTVDPERDSPQVMAKYTARFGPWLIGLTGSEEALEKLRKSYGVYAAMQSSDDKGAYNVMHTAAVFVFDALGRARLLISDVHDSDAVAADLRQLLEQ